jgi:hypothetical protein
MQMVAVFPDGCGNAGDDVGLMAGHAAARRGAARDRCRRGHPRTGGRAGSGESRPW